MSDSHDPDDMADLFLRLHAGEPAAFGEIATRLKEPLRRFARLYLQNYPEIQGLYDEHDAMQSGVSEIWTGILSGTTAAPVGMEDFLRVARTLVARQIQARVLAVRTAEKR